MMTVSNPTKVITNRVMLLLVMLLTSLSLSAQKLTVENMALVPNDITAMDFNHQRQDLNDDSPNQPPLLPHNHPSPFPKFASYP